MNKKQLTEKCRAILHKYPINSIIEDPLELDFLLSVFKNHSEWELKSGVGIHSISVITNFYKNRCFQINRIDNTFTDISFVHCISSKNKLTDLRKACRSAIRSVINHFKENHVIFGESKCPFTNEILFESNTHIDHYDITFDEMFKEFIKDRDIDYLISKINITEDNSISTHFSDDNIINEFVEFHNKKCKLRAVSSKANLSILKY